jgi:hypothetical protein
MKKIVYGAFLIALAGSTTAFAQGAATGAATGAVGGAIGGVPAGAAVGATVSAVAGGIAGARRDILVLPGVPRVGLRQVLVGTDGHAGNQQDEDGEETASALSYILRRSASYLFSIRP